MDDLPNLTDEERHIAAPHVKGSIGRYVGEGQESVCLRCRDPWPCPPRRLLVTINALQGKVEMLEVEREENRQHAQDSRGKLKAVETAYRRIAPYITQTREGNSHKWRELGRIILAPESEQA